ncbi:cysteine synthase A [Tyzzerella sp. An114]|uniref:cysteine synthase A n=1 Tax=Tyzzerella sp. An114 TaxID=1965545 RepID=UPI000B450269|nr:cysteine synthase A [Tyzzerella sp. An114]OUQ59225.1 cysteine synthase A [Tyzzerella sp. An114]HIT73698.1 cysteine synthase A [Candidatus Fimicola cottocaccae]
MAKIYKNISELVGKTPLLEISNFSKSQNVEANIFAKLEYLNPAGSIKDRVAKQMIDDAEKSGILKEGSVIIEPTSGNTGIGIAAIGVSKGYRVIITMPDTMSIERRKILSAYGAELVLTEGSKGMKGAIEKAEELSKEYENSFIPGQFVNPSNPKAHENTTGPEIWNDTDGNVDILVAGIGTGGTISGIGKYLKEKNPNIKIIGVEPYGSPFITKGTAGPHGLQGLGAGFIPDILDTNIYDEVMAVKDEEAYEMGREIAIKEGILVGISSGAALFGAVEVAKRSENKNKNIVVILPDTGDRYLSTPMFE